MKEMYNMSKLEIKEERRWDSESVRIVCVKFGLYTKGDVQEYNKMLDLVDKSEPTALNIYRVAEDIFMHSERETTENIMFILQKEACNTFFTIG